MSSPDDPHVILGVERGASEAEIKKAWRLLARATHPDLHPDDPGAVERFRRGQDAYERLLRGDTAPSGPGASRGRGVGPDNDWMDAAEWMAHAHWATLRTVILPRYVAAYPSGPSLAHAVTQAALKGLLEHPPPVERVPAWARWLCWWRLRRLELRIDPRRTYGEGAIGLIADRTGRYFTLMLRPRSLWLRGVQDEDLVRTVVQRSLDMGIATALPLILGLSGVPLGPVDPVEDRLWWMQRFLWPLVWTGLAMFSGALLVAGYLSRYQGF